MATSWCAWWNKVIGLGTFNLVNSYHSKLKVQEGNKDNKGLYQTMRLELLEWFINEPKISKSFVGTSGIGRLELNFANRSMCLCSLLRTSSSSSSSYRCYCYCWCWLIPVCYCSSWINSLRNVRLWRWRMRWTQGKNKVWFGQPMQKASCNSC